ncbi:MAG: hypothetical protein VXY73_11465 [Pseudomonadota bacterium]|jgi:hypothetical protein|nr:hypothetical protein [Pseudomonadota bacterium]
MLVVPRSLFAAIPVALIGLVYVNAMFFRLSGVTLALYGTIIFFSAVYYFSDSSRRWILLLPAPLFLVGLQDLLVAYFVFLTLQKDGRPSSALERDRDILVLLVLGAVVIAISVLTNGLQYTSSYGFLGRVDVGFIHPNWAPVWGLMLMYYSRHYLNDRMKLFSLFILLLLVVLSGAISAVPPTVLLLFSGVLFRFRRLSYYGLIATVLGVSFVLMTDTSYVTSLLTSGRNVIFDQLISTFTPGRLVLPVDRAELATHTAIVAWYDRFNAGFSGTLPFDNILSAAVASGPLTVTVFFLLTGAFRCPTNKKNFDRMIMFWAIGIGSNPLSMWMPLMLFAVKAAGRSGSIPTETRASRSPQTGDGRLDASMTA